MTAHPTARLARGALVALLALVADAAGASAQSGEQLAGKLLVAAPSMPDPRFAETVIYMVQHDRSGAMGLVVNKVMGGGTVADLIKVPGALEGLDAAARAHRFTVHYGGPVQLNLAFVLHSADYRNPKTLGIDEGMARTATLDVVRAIAAGEGPARHLLAFGYAGWGAGQLEAEMARRDWIVVPADDALVFGTEPDEKWRRAIDKRGLDL